MFNLVKDEFDENMDDILDSINKLLNDDIDGNDLDKNKEDKGMQFMKIIYIMGKSSSGKDTIYNGL